MSTFSLANAVLPASAQRKRLMKHTPHTFLQHAQDQLKKGDCRQASEKLWGAASLALKNVAREVKCKTTSHRLNKLFLQSLVDQCVEERGLAVKIKSGWDSAEALHRNFYEDELEWSTVNGYTEIVAQFVLDLNGIDLSRFDKDVFLSSLPNQRHRMLFKYSVPFMLCLNES